MYTFRNETEEIRFNTTLNKCLIAFKKETSQKKLKKAVACNVNLIRVAKLNHRQGTEFYTYELQLVYDYLNYLNNSGLYEFEEWELDIFRK